MDVLITIEKRNKGVYKLENKYIFSKQIEDNFEHNVQINNYYFNHNYNSAQISYIIKEASFIVVVGDFIHALAPSQTLNETTTKLFECKNIYELVEQTKYLAGRYLILAGDDASLNYVLTDPTVSIPINYTFKENEFMLASHAKYIADKYDYEHSEDAINIKKGAEQQQALPYNITMFEEIKTLIPNHYLDINHQKMRRFFPLHSVDTISLDAAVVETIEQSKNIIKGYFNTRKVALPITSGVDSRAILALMKEQVQDLELYTYYHNEFTEETGDIRIPKELSERLGLNYRTLPIQEMPSELDENITEELTGLENHRILNNGYTFANSDLSAYHPAQGDIISLTKSPFGKDLPESRAKLNYFITKTHNYSSEIKDYLNDWMEDASPYARKSGVSMFDLYNWEYRLGRWLPNNIKNYDYFIDPIYIFNCRYLVELWVRVSRKERTERSFHLEIMKREWPELLEVPFNPDEKIIDKVFSNSHMFYFGSFAKYYAEKWL